MRSTPTGFDYWNIISNKDNGAQGSCYNPIFDRGDTAAVIRKTDTITGYVTKITTDTALSWLARRNTGKPFVLMIHYKPPHRWPETEAAAARNILLRHDGAWVFESNNAGECRQIVSTPGNSAAVRLIVYNFRNWERCSIRH